MVNLSIQWKGTNACCDFTCDCGSRYHIDGDFLYAVKCSLCHRIYDIADQITVKLRVIEKADDFEPWVLTSEDDTVCVSYVKKMTAKLDKTLVGSVRILTDFKHGLVDSMQNTPEDSDTITLTRDLAKTLVQRIDGELYNIGFYSNPKHE